MATNKHGPDTWLEYPPSTAGSPSTRKFERSHNPPTPSFPPPPPPNSPFIRSNVKCKLSYYMYRYSICTYYMTRRWFTANSHAAVDRRCKGDKENHKGKNQLTRTQSCTNFSCVPLQLCAIRIIPSIIAGFWVVIVAVIVVVISTFANCVREFR